MTIEFSIPNGSMRICAEEFFENAGIRQIRKMLALYQRSESRNTEPEEIKAWLEDCEEVFDQGRGQGIFEMCMEVKKIIDPQN